MLNFIKAYLERRKEHKRQLLIVYLAVYCPRFYEDMPPDKAGWFVAECYGFERLSRFYGPTLLASKKVDGLRNAYIMSRELALMYDRKIFNEAVGIYWSVKPFVQKENS